MKNKCEHQRDILKRVLRYARKNHTLVHQNYAASLTSNKRESLVSKHLGRVEAWGQIVRYMEGLVHELDEAIEVHPEVVEDTEVIVIDGTETIAIDMEG